MAECVEGSLRHLLCVSFMHCRCFLLFFFFSVAAATWELKCLMCVLLVCQTLCSYHSQRCFVAGWRLFFFHIISFHFFIYLFYIAFVSKRQPGLTSPSHRSVSARLGLSVCFAQTTPTVTHTLCQSGQFG